MAIRPSPTIGDYWRLFAARVAATRPYMAFNEYVIENPMTIEVSRFRRRFLESGRGKSVNTMILVVAIIAYAAMLLVIANMSGDLPAVAIIHLQTAVFCLIGPAIMFGAIAGEREKRSWDLLLAAPITHAQIVVGKFLAGLMALMTTFVLFLIPALFTLITYRGRYERYSYAEGPGALSIFFQQEMVSLSFGICVLAMTLLFSARCRRALMALGVSLVSLFVVLLVIPLLSAVLVGPSAGADLLVLFHPFVTIDKLEAILGQYTSVTSDDWAMMHGGWYGYPQIALYLIFATIFVVWTYKTVNFADGEKKFIPRTPSA